MKGTFTFALLLLVATSAFAQTSSTNDDAEPVVVPFNVSLIPGISVADAVSQATGAPVINRFSLNILAGRAHALEGVELGSVWNAYTGYVQGAQYAGVANTVDGALRGAQFAGIGNLVGSTVSGAQFGGILNIAGGDVQGYQSAGIVNIADGKLTGAQTSGITSLAGGDVSGAQFSGIASVAAGSVDAQLSGIANVADGDVSAVQVAGIASVASGRMRGLQLSGIASIAGDRSSGAQISGILNAAPRSSGLQLGVVNISRENSGVPIGLVSYVYETGLRYDVWADEAGILSAALRSGNRHISNYLGAGTVVSTNDFTFAWMAGIGVEDDLSRHVFGAVEAVTHSLHDEDFTAWASLSKLRLIAGWKVARTVAIMAGPSLNVFVSPDSDGADLAPWSIYDGRSGDVDVRIWPGFNVGLRFAPRGL